MRGAIHLLFLGVCLAILTLPALNMVFPLFTEAQLSGAVETAGLPRLTLRGIADETFQSGFSTWFAQRYGARATATRLDNSIAYGLFAEAPPEKHVRVGARRVLFLDEQMGHYNRTDRPDHARYAASLKQAQELMLARGKVLIFMLLPTKTNIWREEVPREWSLPLGEPRPCNAQVSIPFKEALRAAGATFVDGPRVLAALGKENPDALYTRTGRHLGPPGMCLVLEEGLRIARPLLRDSEIPTLDCSFHMVTKNDFDPRAEENDLLRLMNVWSPYPNVAVPVMDAELPERVPRERRPDTLVVGTSFGWGVLSEAERNHALGRLRFHYYGKLLVEQLSGPHKPVELGTPDWRDLMESHSLFLMPVPEEYLDVDGAEFLSRVIALYKDQ